MDALEADVSAKLKTPTTPRVKLPSSKSFLYGTKGFSCLEAAFTCFASAWLMWAPGKMSDNAFPLRKFDSIPSSHYPVGCPFGFPGTLHLQLLGGCTCGRGGMLP
eukprot:1183041-Prorocentrum_minimum.AAC.2